MSKVGFLRVEFHIKKSQRAAYQASASITLYILIGSQKNSIEMILTKLSETQYMV